MINNEEINSFYLGKLNAHGASAQGVGWKDESAQQIRFEQLIKIIDTGGDFSINDLGCGTGELINLLEEKFKSRYQYAGYDILQEMIDSAKGRFNQRGIQFFRLTKNDQLALADYTVSSGIFNVRNNTRDEDWQAFILDTVRAMNNCSKKGFAFNALTKYSDAEFMRGDLFYSDPLFLFDYCKKNFGKNVALLHDYTLYDFTILVRK